MIVRVPFGRKRDKPTEASRPSRLDPGALRFSNQRPPAARTRVGALLDTLSLGSSNEQGETP
jgi:hypothetical protein